MAPRLPTFARLLCAAVLAAGAGTSTAFAHPAPPAHRAALAARVAEHPGDVDPRLELAAALREAGRLDAALAELDAAERLAPGRVATLLLRAETLRDAGRAAAADSLLELAVARDPGHEGARRLRGRARAARGDREGADADFAAAIASARRVTPEHYLERARLHESAAPERALAIVAAGAARLGPAASLDAAAIALELALGRHEAALARLDATIARSPRREALLAQRGDLLHAAGRPVEALESWTLALEALETLPGPRRAAPANRALEARLRAALAAGIAP